MLLRSSRRRSRTTITSSTGMSDHILALRLQAGSSRAGDKAHRRRDFQLCGTCRRDPTLMARLTGGDARTTTKNDH